MVKNQYIIKQNWHHISINKHSKKELKYMVNIGVLEEWSASKWVLPFLIHYKKDGQVRQISDLCSLNKCIKHK